MQGGDISNTITEGQTLVNARMVGQRLIDMERSTLGLAINMRYYWRIDLTGLARVMKACESLPRSILVSTDGDQDALEELYDRLNDGYEHPFRGWTCYESDRDLAVMLAWMPNTRVVDIPNMAGTYGVRFQDVPW